MVLPKEQVESTSLELLKAEQSVSVAELQSAVAEMHKAISTQADRVREMAANGAFTQWQAKESAYYTSEVL
jgi:uncharacterized coiled-coil protein SlyX